jgi:hypothetical protein
LLLDRIGDELVNLARARLHVPIISATYARDVCMDMAIQNRQRYVLVHQAPFPHQREDGRKHPDIVSIHVP